MPLARVRITASRPGDLDDILWEWAMDGVSISEAGGLAALNAVIAGLLSTGAVGTRSTFSTMSAYLGEVFPAGEGPAFYVQGLSPGIAIGTGSGGSQLQNCSVSEMVESPRGPAPKGRMFVGPLVSASTPLMTTAARAASVRLMQEVHAAVVAAGFTPVVISRILNKVERATPVGFPIVGYAADLRWDILKSRRAEDPAAAVLFPPTFS